MFESFSDLRKKKTNHIMLIKQFFIYHLPAGDPNSRMCRFRDEDGCTFYFEYEIDSDRVRAQRIIRKEQDNHYIKARNMRSVRI